MATYIENNINLSDKDKIEWKNGKTSYFVGQSVLKQNWITFLSKENGKDVSNGYKFKDYEQVIKFMRDAFQYNANTSKKLPTLTVNGKIEHLYIKLPLVV